MILILFTPFRIPMKNEMGILSSKFSQMSWKAENIEYVRPVLEDSPAPLPFPLPACFILSLVNIG
jgi:hypothetical protein